MTEAGSHVGMKQCGKGESCCACGKVFTPVTGADPGIPYPSFEGHNTKGFPECWVCINCQERDG
jgi:hypothetical protein